METNYILDLVVSRGKSDGRRQSIVVVFASFPARFVPLYPCLKWTGSDTHTYIQVLVVGGRIRATSGSVQGSGKHARRQVVLIRQQGEKE